MSFLPTLNALLNTTSATFLVIGYLQIRRKNVNAHRSAMIGAFASSVLFLVSYLIYHAQVGSKHFTGTGAIRPVYFALLLSHTVLAALIVPMILVTLRRAFGGRFEAHRALARWTWPAWMYVSITGVVIYVMLYHVYR